MTEPPTAPTDTEHVAALLARARSGESAALDELIGRALGIARRYSAAVCGQAPDREDAVQEALMQTFRHARGIREPRAFRSWLYRAVKNACLIGRRRKPAVPLDGDGREEAIDPSRGADELVSAGEDRERLQDALAALSPAYREVVFLRDLEGLSTREVARVLGITEPNVKVRLHRAHTHLRKRLAGTNPRRA
jgi:RNA polymerase sigma-70 factor (ECF subfamily)